MASDKENRRRIPRVALRIQLGVTILGAITPTTVDVMTRNISASGLGFVSRRMFSFEERLAIVLRIPKVPPKLILSRITFSRYISVGWYESGAEFLECISDTRTANQGMPRIPNHWLLASGQIKTSHSATACPPATAAVDPRSEAA